MNWCWFILKGVQMVLSALIGILFVVPERLVVNDEALVAPGKTNLTSVDTRIRPGHIACSLNYDFRLPEAEWLGTKPNVEFPDDYERNEGQNITILGAKTSLSTTRNTLGCLKYFNQSKYNCMCWPQQTRWVIITVIVVSVFVAATSLCDMVSIYAAEGQDEQTTFMQGIGSCYCSIFTGLLWVVMAIVIMYFLFVNWPYKYEDADDDDDKYFFKLPNAWLAAVVFCFSFALIMVMEGIIYLGESGREIVPLPHALQDDKKPHRSH